MLQFLGKSRTDPLVATTISKTEHPTIPREKYKVATIINKTDHATILREK